MCQIASWLANTEVTQTHLDGLVSIVIDRAWRVLVEQARMAALAAPSLHAVATINLPFQTDFIIPTSGNKSVQLLMMSAVDIHITHPCTALFLSGATARP